MFIKLPQKKNLLSNYSITSFYSNQNRIYDGLTIICYINTFFDLTYIKKRPSCKEMASSNIDYYAVIFALKLVVNKYLKDFQNYQCPYMANNWKRIAILGLDCFYGVSRLRLSLRISLLVYILLQTSMIHTNI